MDPLATQPDRWADEVMVLIGAREPCFQPRLKSGDRPDEDRWWPADVAEAAANRGQLRCGAAPRRSRARQLVVRPPCIEACSLRCPPTRAAQRCHGCSSRAQTARRSPSLAATLPDTDGRTLAHVRACSGNEVTIIAMSSTSSSSAWRSDVSRGLDKVSRHDRADLHLLTLAIARARSLAAQPRLEAARQGIAETSCTVDVLRYCSGSLYHMGPTLQTVDSLGAMTPSPHSRAGGVHCGRWSGRSGCTSWAMCTSPVQLVRPLLVTPGLLRAM